MDIANGGQRDDGMEIWLESMRLAVEALEKQIPKKPLLDEKFPDYYFCSCCYGVVEPEVDKNCAYCGQAIEGDNHDTQA